MLYWRKCLSLFYFSFSYLLQTFLWFRFHSSLKQNVLVIKFSSNSSVQRKLAQMYQIATNAHDY